MTDLFSVFSQQISLSNATQWPVPLPIHVGVADLASGVTVSGDWGVTRHVAPLGIPLVFVRLPVGTDYLAPGQTTTAVVNFEDPNNLPITYTPRVFAGARP